MSTQRDIARDLTERGTTFALEAGIRLDDKPAPLYQLLVLTTLLSARIRSDIAVAAARELFAEGWRTPGAMRSSSWQQRVDALGRAGYVRYDESTAEYLAKAAEQVRDEYSDDLRALRRAADGDLAELRRRITAFPRIGPVGAEIFCREVQAVWPEVRPYLDRRALRGAERAGLPADPRKLAKLVPGKDFASFAAALVREKLGH